MQVEARSAMAAADCTHAPWHVAPATHALRVPHAAATSMGGDAAGDRGRGCGAAQGEPAPSAARSGGAGSRGGDGNGASTPPTLSSSLLLSLPTPLLLRPSLSSGLVLYRRGAGFFSLSLPLFLSPPPRGAASRACGLARRRGRWFSLSYSATAADVSAAIKSGLLQRPYGSGPQRGRVRGVGRRRPPRQPTFRCYVHTSMWKYCST